MEAYTGFAQVYDTFMDETPYQAWAELIDHLILEYGISRPAARESDGTGRLSEAQQSHDADQAAAVKRGSDTDLAKAVAETAHEEALLEERNLVLELGCGTGTLTELLSQKGYDMIGIDSSEEMLQIAMEKKAASGSEILYLCQDMRDIDLYSTVGTVISVCDSVNYLLEDEDVADTFALIENYLYPGGIFIFDFNTLYKYETVIGDTTIAENREDCSFIWENYFHEDAHINEYDLTLFVKQEEELFQKLTETHYQRGYTLEEMEHFVAESGLTLLKVMDADTQEAPTPESERIYMIAKKKS